MQCIAIISYSATPQTTPCIAISMYTNYRCVKMHYILQTHSCYSYMHVYALAVLSKTYCGLHIYVRLSRC